MTRKTCIFQFTALLFEGNIQIPRQLGMLSHGMIQVSFVTVTFTPDIKLLSRWENLSCLQQQKGSEPELNNISSITRISWNQICLLDVYTLHE